MAKYTIQRPATIWLETVVEADTEEQAFELADNDFNNGEYVELYQTWNIDFDKFWLQDEEGRTSIA